MKYSMIKTAGLALFLLLVFGGCKFQPEGAEVHVVATTTDSQSEAVRLAEKYRKAGYQSEIYKSPAGIYTVTLGKYPLLRANEIRDEVILKDLVDPDKVLISEGGAFGQKIYPAGEPAENPTTFASDNMYHIIADSMRTKADAIRRSNKLIRDGYYSEVYLKSNQYYMVTIGHFPQERARQVRNDAVKYNLIPEGAYLSSGSEFVERVYSFKEADNRDVFSDNNPTPSPSGTQPQVTPSVTPPAASNGNDDDLPPVYLPGDPSPQTVQPGTNTPLSPRDQKVTDTQKVPATQDDDVVAPQKEPFDRFNRDAHDHYQPPPNDRFNRDDEPPKKKDKEKEKEQ